MLFLCNNPFRCNKHMVMKHIFVINPKAGKSDKEKSIRTFLKKYDGKLDYEVYLTTCKSDGYRFVNEYLSKRPEGEKTRFYACGGDGSLHDVINGVVGYKDVEVTQYATGSGNDFVKSVGGLVAFQNLAALIEGEPIPVDLIEVNGSYCINIANAGFDGEVTYEMAAFKRLPFVSGPLAYSIATFTSLLFKINQWMKVTVDGNLLYEGKALLVAMANGHTYGGGYLCAPLAKISDGLIDVCLLKKTSRLKTAGLVKVYKAGKHLVDPKTVNIVIYKKCQETVIESKKPLAYCIDGEIFKSTRIEAHLVPNSIMFVKPKASI